MLQREGFHQKIRIREMFVGTHCGVYRLRLRRSLKVLKIDATEALINGYIDFLVMSMIP